MTHWYTKKPRLTSLTLHRPGLIGLLSHRTFLINPFSTVCHYGMVFGLLTGLFLEAMYLATFAGVFRGWGWVVTWVHAILGLVATVGFIGVLGRFLSNRFFRLASGAIFYVDAPSIAAIMVSGIALFLELIKVAAVVPGWWALIHIVSAISWLVVSLFAGGLVAHAVGTVFYRFSNPRERAALQAFNTACGRCGKCTEVCPLYRAHDEAPQEAPPLKVRRYLSAVTRGAPRDELVKITEEVYGCALCGLCVAVCPYLFRHTDLYLALLGQLNPAPAGTEVESP